MNNQNGTSKNKVSQTTNNVKTKLTNLVEGIRNSLLFRVTIVIGVAVAGIVAVGGFFRVLAWMMIGWGQLNTALKSK